MEKTMEHEMETGGIGEYGFKGLGLSYYIGETLGLNKYDYHVGVSLMYS